ncbi:hypothetical protein K439DRAFT_1649642 [Ramaria rubella]|nr:hypothetical protein K439DRAFT_1649642 [Ramaria rubella]
MSCRNQGLRETSGFHSFGVEEPCWEGLPHCNICKVIINDVLHGLDKAFHDHTCQWCINIVGKLDIDRCYRLKPDIVKAVRAELDFIFTAKWKHLTEADLDCLKEYDEIYDENHEAFRGDDHWAIPKKHARKHYPDHIRWAGATNNYSTEISERCHIDMVKMAYEHTNWKEYIPQIITYLT